MNYFAFLNFQKNIFDDIWFGIIIKLIIMILYTMVLLPNAPGGCMIKNAMILMKIISTTIIG